MMPSLRALQSGGAILCFHSVTTPTSPAEASAHVSVDAFASFVRLGRRLGEFVPARELVGRHLEGRSTAGLLALTFDDAYVALLTELKAFVSEHGVPITVFVATGAAASGATFWWDRVDDLYSRVTPQRWRAFEDACGLPDTYRDGQPREFGPLRPLRQWLLAAHAGRWPAHLEAPLAQLERDAAYHTTHRSMTFAELAELASLPGVELGVHTVSHPVLPLLSDQAMRQEIEGAYSALHDRFANVVPMLAVPFGLYDQRTLRLARSAGMQASLTLAGRLRESSHEGAVPRLCITSNDSALKLAIRLLGVPDLLRHASVPATVAYPDLPSPTT